MNEELKIIIKAVVDDAKKNVKAVSDEVKELGKKGGDAAKSFGAAMSKMAVAVAAAAAAVVAGISAMVSSLLKLEESTRQFREEQAKLVSAFQSVGLSAKSAGETYKGLYRFLGDSSKATEAAAHLAKLTTNEKNLAEWTKALQGIYATFGDSLPIEGLTEAANETARVGKVTGTFADALNWAGVSEDAFNTNLAKCTTLSEREALIRSTLNGLYSKASELYEQNNKDIIALNESQAKLDMVTARIGNTIAPLKTAFNELKATVLNAFAPAIQFVSKILSTVIQKLSQAVVWVSKLINAIAGKDLINLSSGFGEAANKAGEISNKVSNITSNIGNSISGAKDLTKELKNAAKASKELNNKTEAFDELIKVKGKEAAGEDPTSGLNTIKPEDVYVGDLGTVGTGKIEITTEGVEDTESLISRLAGKIKDLYNEYIKPFVDDIAAIGKMMYEAIEPYITPLIDNFKKIGSGIFDVFKGVIKVVQGAFRIITGFLTGNADKVYDGWETIKDGFSLIGDGSQDAVDGLVGATSAVEDMAGALATNVFENIGKTIGDIWDDASAKFEETKLGKFLLGVTDKAVTLTATVKEKSADVREKVANAWSTVKDKAATLNTNIKEKSDKVRANVYKAWSAVKTKSATLTATVKDKASKTRATLTTSWNTVKTKTATLTANVKESANSARSKITTAWSNLKSGVTTLSVTFKDSFTAAMKRIWNGLVKGVNKAIDTINNIPGVNISKLTYLAKGGIVNGATPAVIGEAGREAVLPLENNTEWMDILADRIAAKNSAPSKIVLQLDGKELGWANIRSINNITKQTGKIQLLV
jgi:phage-related protein